MNKELIDKIWDSIKIKETKKLINNSVMNSVKMSMYHVIGLWKFVENSFWNKIPNPTRNSIEDQLKEELKDLHI